VINGGDFRAWEFTFPQDVWWMARQLGVYQERVVYAASIWTRLLDEFLGIFIMGCELGPWSSTCIGSDG